VYDEYLKFSRIGGGSLGGKARDWHFLMQFSRRKINDNFKDVIISIPRTIVLSTEVYEEFMESNNLYQIGMSGQPDEEILDRFIKCKLPEYVYEDLEAILVHC